MKVILLHGLNTNPTEKWYPWFAKEMQQRNIHCEVPALPGDNDPHLSEWLAEIDKLEPDENTMLIGHSRGGVALLRWLEVQPVSLKVKKVILIATNSGHAHKMPFPDESNHGFYTKQGYDFAKIKQHCDDFVVFHSKDDQWVPYEHGRENAKGLSARLLAFENHGHFGKDTKVIPELLREIEAATYKLEPVSTTTDYQQLLDIQIECIVQLADTYTMKERDDWMAYLKEAGPERYADFQNVAFVHDEKIVAYVSWALNKEQSTGSIECLYVLPAFRRQGLASRLLQKAEAAIRARPIHVRSTLNAQPFYEKHGYTFVSHTLSRAGFKIALMEKKNEAFNRHRA